MNNQTAQLQAQAPVIAVTFVSGYTFRVLCKAELPALPFPGDFLNLGILAYQVTGHNWHLMPGGKVDIRVVLIPQIGENGDRPFAYPEEKNLPAFWGPLSAGDEESRT